MPEITRADLNTELVEYVIPLDDCRYLNGTLLGPTAGAWPLLNMGCEPGTHGAKTPMLVGITLNNNDFALGFKVAAFDFGVPIEANQEWVGMSESMHAPFLRFRAHVTATRTVEASIGLSTYWVGNEANFAEGVTLYTDWANVNNTAWRDYDFPLPTANLSWFAPGNRMRFEIFTAATDTGGDRDGRIEIGKISIAFLVRG